MSAATLAPEDEVTGVWWCARGSLVTLVRAPSAAVAASVALERFRQRGRAQLDPAVSVREADASDVAAWELLVAQQRAGAEGCRVEGDEVVPESEQVSLFA